MALGSIKAELEAAGDLERAEFNRKYLKAEPGEYGEGDEFIGLTVPVTRAIAKKYRDLPYKDIEELLSSPIHEFRLCGLEILMLRFDKWPDERQKIYDFCFTNIKAINNWDLVDGIAPSIVGEHLQDKSRKKLYELARSKNLWERRIAIVATCVFIKKHQFADTITIAEVLLHDEHELIHKATGWMLRETGKKSKTVLEGFLKKHAATMPRTTLRYAIERFTPKERKYWMNVGKGKQTVSEPEPYSHKKSMFLERLRKQ